MKTKTNMKKLLLLGLVALGIIATGCSKDDVPQGGNTGKETGSIRVALQSEAGTSRAVGTPTTDEERTVVDFTVYVFNYATGAFEKKQTFTENLTGEIGGLNVASQKRVVVLANVPAGFPAVNSYSDLSQAMVALSTQTPNFSTTGLFMSGEAASAVTLRTDDVVGVPVQVKRLVAKVRVGTLTVTPAEGLSLDNFELTGMSIQKARDKAPALGGMPTTGFSYVGGVVLADDHSGAVAQSYLKEAYSLAPGYVSGTPLTPNVYFYVFPNDNTDNESTLFSLHGTYNGETMYYSFYINDQVGSGENATDGNYIQRNKIYTLNILLKKLGNGGDDPNVPSEEASMEVTVTVADWEGELIQDVEW